MPELPEVETVVRELRKNIVAKKIMTLRASYPKLICASIVQIKDNVDGQTITAIERFGKYILICLENQKVIRVHLRMEGKFYLTDRLIDESIDKHVHGIFSFSDGTYLKYHDVRKFGTFEIISYFANWHEESKFSTLGFEPWESGCTEAFISAKLQKSQMMIKPNLLNQKTIVGLGNIYVDEVLHLSNIHPTKICSTLKSSQIKAIAKNADEVLKKAIALGGTTIRSYHSTMGIDGLFQNELLVHLRKGEACYRCNTKIIKEKISGRGSYYCPKCQVK
ncbi:MAG: DNA-formamidopyrimidine glycosylase [Culicoidibacterales bacterium]